MLEVDRLSYPGLPHQRGGNRREITQGKSEQLTLEKLITKLSNEPIKFLHDKEESYGRVLTHEDKELLKVHFKKKGELENLVRQGVKNEVKSQGGSSVIDIDLLVSCIIELINFESNPCIGGEIYKAYSQLYIFGNEGESGLVLIADKIDKFVSFPGTVIESISKILNNFANRNSIQTPLPSELKVNLNGEDVSFKVSEVLMGGYEKIDVGLGLNTFNTLFDIVLGEKDEIGNFKRIDKSGIPSYGLGAHKGKDQVYRKGLGDSEQSFVRLKDKLVYLEKRKGYLLNELQSYTIHNLMYSKKLTHNDDDVLNEINDLYSKGYITRLDIEKQIKIWLRKKTDKIVGKIANNDINFDTLDIGIIGWGILNGAFIEYVIKELERKTGKDRTFFTRYVDRVDNVELIFNSIIKKS